MASADEGEFILAMRVFSRSVSSAADCSLCWRSTMVDCFVPISSAWPWISDCKLTIRPLASVTCSVSVASLFSNSVIRSSSCFWFVSAPTCADCSSSFSCAVLCVSSDASFSDLACSSSMAERSSSQRLARSSNLVRSSSSC